MKTMNYSLIRILFALVIGLVLVIWPNAAASYIVITVGVAFLIPGVISLFGYFGRKRQEGEAAPRFPIEGIGSLLFGLWLIVMPEFFADVFIGIYPDYGRSATDCFFVDGSSVDARSGSFLSDSFADSYCGYYRFVQSDRSA